MKPRPKGTPRDARTERIDPTFERTQRADTRGFELEEAAAPSPPASQTAPPPAPAAPAPEVPLGHDEPLGAGEVPPERLIRLAREIRDRAYAPYSRFKVGAAVVTDAGVFTGVNVENASYPLSVCAERNAIATVVAAGARRVIAVGVIADTPEPVSPCGGCRQVIREYGAGATVYLANLRGSLRATTIDALLPGAFGPEDLGVPSTP
ncbi:MAG TPA: cytidine deaminase [Planctomycetota bacterium]|nr:cytidine deaminase [Planctomycetota bacterium]